WTRLVAGATVIFGLSLALLQAAAPPAPRPVWARSLLESVHLTPAKAQLDPNRWAGGGPHRLSTFQRLWDDWRQVDPTALGAARDFLAAQDSFEGLVATAAPFIDVKPLPAARSAERKVPGAEGGLPGAVASLHAALGRP